MSVNNLGVPQNMIFLREEAEIPIYPRYMKTGQGCPHVAHVDRLSTVTHSQHIFLARDGNGLCLCGCRIGSGQSLGKGGLGGLKPGDRDITVITQDTFVGNKTQAAMNLRAKVIMHYKHQFQCNRQNVCSTGSIMFHW